MRVTMAYNHSFFRFCGRYSDRPRPPLGVMPRGEVVDPSQVVQPQRMEQNRTCRAITATMQARRAARNKAWIDIRTEKKANG
jgi:hypothetical protein